MKKIIIILLSIWLHSPLATATEKKCSHDANNFRCVKYRSNYDGDSITFDIKGVHPLFGKNAKIRLSGVDTPEIKSKNKCEKKKARLAKDFVAKILGKAKKIHLENVSRGKYFRIVADVKFDGKSLGKMLLKRGLAYPYDGDTKPKVNWCK